jgi:WD40 repeat protein
MNAVVEPLIVGMQEYHYHLGAVNTITFIEEGKMFVSTSDDKTLRVWELGIPVQARFYGFFDSSPFVLIAFVIPFVHTSAAVVHHSSTPVTLFALIWEA